MWLYPRPDGDQSNSGCCPSYEDGSLEGVSDIGELLWIEDSSPEYTEEGPAFNKAVRLEFPPALISFVAGINLSTGIWWTSGIVEVKGSRLEGLDVTAKGPGVFGAVDFSSTNTGS